MFGYVHGRYKNLHSQNEVVGYKSNSCAGQGAKLQEPQAIFKILQARCGAKIAVETARRVVNTGSKYRMTISGECLDERGHIDEWRHQALLSSASRLLSSIAKLFEGQQQKQPAQADHIDCKQVRDEQIQNY